MLIFENTRTFENVALVSINDGYLKLLDLEKNKIREEKGCFLAIQNISNCSITVRYYSPLILGTYVSIQNEDGSRSIMIYSDFNTAGLYETLAYLHKGDLFLHACIRGYQNHIGWNHDFMRIATLTEVDEMNAALDKRGLKFDKEFKCIVDK